MADKKKEATFHRRDVGKEGSSLSGSKSRNNISTDKTLHPEREEASPSDVIATVDQDPGERQKVNQNQSKDNPLAA